MIDEESQPPEDADLLPGGDFIAPDVSDEAYQFIQACRRLIYAEEFTPIVKQALTGAGSLADGIAPVIVELVTRAEDKLGPLGDEDFESVVTHLAGTLVSTAKMLGDPEAEDAQSVVEDVSAIVADMMQGQEGQSGEEAAPEEGAEQAPPGALGQLR